MELLLGGGLHLDGSSVLSDPDCLFQRRPACSRRRPV